MRNNRTYIGLILGLFLPWSALAGINGTPFYEFDYVYDDNVYQVDDKSSVVAPNETTDHYIEHRFGGAVLWEYSRQSVDALIALGTVDYDNNQNLDHENREIEAGWNWSITPFTNGRLFYRETEELENLDDNENTDERGIISQDEIGLSGNWSFAARWAVRAELAQTGREYSNIDSQLLDLDTQRHLIALDYLGIPIGKVSAEFEQIAGDFPNRNADNSNLALKYDETNIGVRIGWVPSGVSEFNARIFHTARDDDDNARNVSRMSWDLAYIRSLSRRTRWELKFFQLTQAADRQIANYQESIGASSDFRWRFGPALRASLQLEMREVRFDGQPSVNPSREDTLTRAGIELTWAPSPLISVIPHLDWEHLDSNFDGQNDTINERYEGLTAGIKVRLALDTE